MRNIIMKYLSLFVLISLCSSLSYGKTRDEHLNDLKQQCTKVLSTKMALDKGKLACGCINARMAKKLSEKQIEHLYLVSIGMRNQTSLSVDEGALTEDYEALIAAKCLGQQPPVPQDKSN